MSSDNQTNRNSSTNESDKSALGGSNSGNLSSDFQSTDAASSGQNILPEAQGGTVTSGNAGTQGQTGTSTLKTTSGQASEGISNHYKK